MIANTAHAKSRTVDKQFTRGMSLQKGQAKLEDDVFEDPVVVLPETPQL